MILVDTSVWIDHFRNGGPRLTALLEAGSVLTHPFVSGELALGNLRSRATILSALADLPQSIVADDHEVLGLIETAGLYGRGNGYVDAHLMAAARLTPGAGLWTKDRRLAAVAGALGLDAPS